VRADEGDVDPAGDHRLQRGIVSTIKLFDGLVIADFAGLPASASRWL
jgi:hypothetical protein